MSKQETGGNEKPKVAPFPGDLLDYFAGQAMGALVNDDVKVISLNKAAKKEGMTFREGTARAAYNIADAMIKEKREREKR